MHLLDDEIDCADSLSHCVAPAASATWRSDRLSGWAWAIGYRAMGYRARMRLAMRAGERHAAAMATARQHMRRASRRGRAAVWRGRIGWRIGYPAVTCGGGGVTGG